MVDGHDLTLVTAGLSAITLITGFVVFAAVRRSLPFDRRLVLSGYRHSALIAAKTTAALAQAVGIGAYAAAVMLAFWRPAGIWAIAAAFILGAATYAAFGLLIGVLVRGDLEGFFLIIMISHAGHLPGKPGGQPAGEQADPGVLPLLRPDPVRRRRSLPPSGAGQHGGPIPGLDSRLRPTRAGGPATAAAPASAQARPGQPVPASAAAGCRGPRDPAGQL